MRTGILRKSIITAIVLILTVLYLSMSAYADVSAIAASYGKLPIAFEANEGQVDPK
ncbi:MAG: hypothetical protein HQK99_14170, partial [Nitrospirae bacterium]|nr:hypothetical protein [Nitrospirota bacterium]